MDPDDRDTALVDQATDATSPVVVLAVVLCLAVITALFVVTLARG